MSAVTAYLRAQGAQPAVPTRQQTSVQGYLRAQGLVDNLTHIYTPDNIRSMLDSLKASVDIANVSAKGQRDWDVYYAEFGRYYDREINKWGVTYTQSTMEQIQQREREFADWQQRLKKRGIDTGPPRRPEDPDPTGVPRWLKWLAATLAAGAVVEIAKALILRPPAPPPVQVAAALPAPAPFVSFPNLAGPGDIEVDLGQGKVNPLLIHRKVA